MRKPLRLVQFSFVFVLSFLGTSNDLHLQNAENIGTNDVDDSCIFNKDLKDTLKNGNS